MNRRDFLLLRRERDLHVVELSCRTLYMRYLDTQITGAEPTEDGYVHDPWNHEPPAVLSRRTADDLFNQIDETLREADVLRLVDRAWASGELGERLDRVAKDFVARGRRVEVAPAQG
jgi:hypothetical protein